MEPCGLVNYKECLLISIPTCMCVKSIVVVLVEDSRIEDQSDHCEWFHLVTPFPHTVLNTQCDSLDLSLSLTWDSLDLNLFLVHLAAITFGWDDLYTTAQWMDVRRLSVRRCAPTHILFLLPFWAPAFPKSCTLLLIFTVSVVTARLQGLLHKWTTEHFYK